MDNLKWSDTDMMDFARMLTSYEAPEHWKIKLDEFKASKQPKPDYEILTCYQNDINISHTYIGEHGSYKGSGDSCKNQGCNILSIKRLSDGEVFCVRDVTDLGTIESFHITKVGMEAHFTNGCGATLRTLQKVKEPVSLFTTEDGVNIYSWHEVVWFVNSAWYLGSEQASCYDVEKLSHLKYFSKTKAAEEYILMNKPCLSLNDIIAASPYKVNLEGQKGNIHFEELKKIVQSKL